jgi:hypothetical protein
MDQPITPKTLPDGIEAVVEDLMDHASSHPHDSLKRDTILAEAAALRAMLDAIRTRPSAEWKRQQSPLLAATTREYLDIPTAIVERVGHIYEAYRRCSPRPCPRCGFPLRSENAKQCFQCGADWH